MSTSSSKKRGNFKGKTLYQTVEYVSDDGIYSEVASEGTHDPSEGSEDSDEALNFMAYTEPKINLMSSYEIIKEGTVVVKSPGSVKLPLYEAVLDNKLSSKAVIDSEATTQYVSEKAVKELGVNVVKVKPRKVIIADKEVVTVNGICTFEMKLGDLPAETVTAYTFPLGSVDLILGLPWLQKHNPHTDYRTLSFEFTRNGRRYCLYPRKPVPTIRVASPEEFKSFMDSSTSLYLISRKDLRQAAKSPEEGKEQTSASQSENTKRNEPPKPTKLPRKLLRWIKRKCPDLLRDMGQPADLEPFKIDTGDAEPIKISPRPSSPVDLAKIKEFIDENLKNGVISESESPWSFPLVLAAKPNGGIRVCVDYRALNRITQKDAHPLPRIDESFLKFFGMEYFSTIDLRSGYWQILLDLLSRPKTAFSSRYGHYEWNVIPFGLSNVPGAFQRRMNKVLRKYIDKFCIVYLDDILIFSKTREEHDCHVKTILRALNNARMILNLEKCNFFASEIKFLGHLIDKNGSRPDPRNIEKIVNWPTPRNITDVRGFCNLAGHYRKYIDHFATLSLPLTDLMKGSPAKGAEISWGEREEVAFQALKKAVTSEPVLKHAQIGKPFVIDPDSSQYAIGAVLLQLFQDADGKERLHPVAFESKKLTETEQRYSSQERELLAAKYALDHWRYIIEGSEITIRTDHESLKGYRTKNPMTKRLTRFLNDIEHFNPLFVYRPGPLQKVPDALSRMPGLKEEGQPADTERFYTSAQAEPTEPTRRRNIEYYRKLRKYVKALSMLDDAAEELKKDAIGYELRDGKLYNRELNSPVIVTLEDLVAVVDSVHKDLGHYGKKTTIEAIRQRFEVASDSVLWDEAVKILEACMPCQLFKSVPEDKAPPIHPYGVQKAFALWELDFVGPWLLTPRGMLYLITAIDYCTSKAIVYPLKARSAQAAIEVLEEIIWTYGKPARIITDNGEEFKSKEFKAVVKRYGIKAEHTTPGHPQTNGKVERLNYELLKRVQRISAEEGNNKHDWDLYIRQALFAFHAHKNERLGATPFFLQHGVEPVLPSTSLVNTPITRLEVAEAAEYRKQHVQNLTKHRTDAARKYQAALERLTKSREDQSSPTSPILNGDLVMRLPLNRKSKLYPQWNGPFVVISSNAQGAYQLASANGHTLDNLVNQERLRKLEPDERTKYAGEFWEASNRLKLYDRRAKEQDKLRAIDAELAKATKEHLEAQKHGLPSSLQKQAELSSQRRQLIKTIRSEEPPPQPSAAPDLGKRIRRLPTRYRTD